LDRRLLEKIREGDNEAFAVLYNNYADYALRVAMTVTRNKMSAADAVQETFIRVYRNINSFDLEKTFEPWFYKILINECNRILGKDTKTIAIDDFIENSSDHSKEDDYKFEEYETLYKAIDSLEDMSRIPIVLSYLKGFKDSEIAEILGLNINTIKSRLFKGRQKLKRIIERLEETNKGDGSYGR
jgi:RNA polymerase sigma-70 factor (ECF subfamily)